MQRLLGQCCELRIECLSFLVCKRAAETAFRAADQIAGRNLTAVSTESIELRLIAMALHSDHTGALTGVGAL